MAFKIKCTHIPAGDQPNAIKCLVKSLKKDKKHITLLGVTGSGKTFTVANVIEKINKPTLVIAHNKTLAAQLAQEYKTFFPNNAVHYFVSYYDYYQPEAYVPVSDTYISKEVQINAEIDRLRHATTQSLLTRKDVIVVASVSAIYGLGNPEEYKGVHFKVHIGLKISREDFVRKVIRMFFERTKDEITPGKVRVTSNRVEVMPVNERVVYQVFFDDNSIKDIVTIDAFSRAVVSMCDKEFLLFPAKHFVSKKEERDDVLKQIKKEMKSRLAELRKQGKPLEADRLERRTKQDLSLIAEIGYCNGIENYSRFFDKRQPGEPPYTLISYFPKDKDGNPDFLTVVDESHVTLPQIGGMYAGDRARKDTLIKFGFRLPSAFDNRPLTFEEFNEKVGKLIYTSATPGDYELEQSGKADTVEQIIRPTGLLDPEIDIRPVTGDGKYIGQVEDSIKEIEKTIKKKGRILITTLTKKSAEDLADFFKEKNIQAEYMHSDIKTMDRTEILTNFRKGEFDVLIGVNLLREGLDLPEVSLVVIMDADREGFLRTATSLIQTIGRAARNANGRVILYADSLSKSLKTAVDETNRRREIQAAHNKANNITPQTIKKAIVDITEEMKTRNQKTASRLFELDKVKYKHDPISFIREKKLSMERAVERLDFETAAILRDEIKKFKTE